MLRPSTPHQSLTATAARGSRPAGASATAVVAMALLALTATGCFSSTPPPAEADPVVLPQVTLQPTQEAQPVTAQLRAQIEDYWTERDSAWAAGPGAGIAFSVTNNHPLLDYTARECADAWFGGLPPPGFAERSQLLSDTIVGDPDFTMPVGPLAGRDLGEGLLAMDVLFSYEGLGVPVANRLASVHLQVSDEQVRHFLVCEDVPITVVEVGQAPDLSGDGDASAGGGTVNGSGSLVDPVTVLPPVTLTPAPVTPPSGSSGGDDGASGGSDDGDDSDGSVGGGGSTAPNPPGSRPDGSGVDFCDTPPSGDAPSAGDYYLCPDDDEDLTATEEPTAQPSDDITRG